MKVETHGELPRRNSLRIRKTGAVGDWSIKAVSSLRVLNVCGWIIFDASLVYFVQLSTDQFRLIFMCGLFRVWTQCRHSVSGLHRVDSDSLNDFENDLFKSIYS